uniref:Uncharacterized protein n=1 Tax=Panagrolaimus sp. JU765 TaxID=591449 RepID=A0AC34PVE4_9BILA
MGESTKIIKAKKGKRKPLPKKIAEKHAQRQREKKLEAKQVKKKIQRDGTELQKVGDQWMLKRNFIAKDPSYEGVYRSLVPEIVADLDQDHLDAVYVDGITAEMHYLLLDEEQAKPRVEKLTEKDLKCLTARNTDAVYEAIDSAYATWSAHYFKGNDAAVADIIMAERTDQKDLIVPMVTEQACENSAATVADEDLSKNQTKLSINETGPSITAATTTGPGKVSVQESVAATGN